MRTNLMLYPVRIGVAICTTLMLMAGCAEERATAPSPPELLRAMNLTDQLVLDVSDWVVAESTAATDAFGVSLGHLPMVQEHRIDDIQIEFWSRRSRFTHDMRVFTPTSDTWDQIEFQSNCGPLIVGPGPLLYSSTRLLSGYGIPDVSSLIDSQGSVQIRVKEALSLRGRTMVYSPLYTAVPVGVINPEALCATAVDGTDLWTSQWYMDSTDTLVDSIFVYNLAGERIRTHALPSRHLLSMCYDSTRSHIWGMTLPGPIQLVRMNRNADIEESIEIPTRVRSGIAWQDDRVWFLTGEMGISSLIGVNTQASIDSGYAVIDRRYTFSPGRTFFRTIFFEDGTLYDVSSFSLTQFTYLGEMIGQWSLPVRAETGASAGGSLWLLHQGPQEVKSGATLLSRFILPRSTPIMTGGEL